MVTARSGHNVSSMHAGPEARQFVEVAVAIVRRDGLWLVARRRPGVHLGGLWEFPGGKLHPGETAAQAALRELMEECAIEARVERVLDPVVHRYEDRTIRLHPVLCAWERGEPRPLGSDACGWVSTETLPALEMPALSRIILTDLLAT